MRLDSLTGLRFLAALWVVLTHTVTAPTNPEGMINFGRVVGRVAELGYLGVTFFFTLSGFVLTWSASGKSIQAADFYRRRFARIYPLHLATTVLAGAVLVATGGAVAVAAWPLCLLLVQAWVPDSATYLALNSVSWSLACEAFFYLLTPALLGWSAKRSSTACVVAAGGLYGAMGVAAVTVLTFAPSRDQDVWFSPWYSLGTFTSGMALALVLRRGLTRWPSLLAASAAAAATLGVLIFLSWSVELGRTAATVIALPAVLVVIGAAARHDLQGRPGWLRSRVMVRLGEWSFALYLTHKMVFSFFRQHVAVMGEPFLFFVALAVAIAVSAAAHQWFERPLERKLRPQVGP